MWNLASRTTCSSSATIWCGIRKCRSGCSRTKKALPLPAMFCWNECATTSVKPSEDITAAAHHWKVVGRYKGRIAGWDVVNEALNDDGTLRPSAWKKIIGDDYIEMAFRYAHED